MAKIPFDIKYRPKIESGKYKVETKDGRPVEIVKWDLRSPHGSVPILAIIHGDYDCNRAYSDKGYSTIDSDRLFIVAPDEELTEFEKKVADVIDLWHEDYEQWGKPGASAHNYPYQIKEDTEELLAVAREELFANDAVLKEYAEISKEQGKAEALKDLPRWKKAAASFGNYSVAPTETGQLCLLIDGYYIMLSDLKKLPGFNE